MQDDCITILLGLPEVRVLGQEEKDEGITVEVMYRAESAFCPRCGHKTPKVHSVQTQRKRDRRLWDKPVFLLLHKRRFRCWACHKVFTEPDPVFGVRKSPEATLSTALAGGFGSIWARKRYIKRCDM